MSDDVQREALRAEGSALYHTLVVGDATSTDAAREKLAAALYAVMEWSGCAGSAWERLDNNAQRQWRTASAALLTSGVVQVHR